ncbi:hypothetical protein [Sphingomonas sp. ID0503]
MPGPDPRETVDEHDMELPVGNTSTEEEAEKIEDEGEPSGANFA